ncbi:hypothetical protein DNHGIG_27160 [Collibacillus ludicampi]|uniref:Uncharacterized protein n=1 Tax=Collibacillus ludicampi TaxID=2771369 RepID=A0AAV4LH72_9BACL|nr:hypothetical protein [Collibacillus ludicampi]GIM47167.1 hypothetical protein DNHGIG_27160 [Collibacillus ludicampi]
MDVLVVMLLLIIAMLSGGAFATGNYYIGFCALSFSMILMIPMLTMKSEHKKRLRRGMIR